MNLLCGENLSIGYKGRTLTSGLNPQLRAGELVCLLGPNGAGKTTLLKTLAGLLPPLGGKVLLKGQEMHQLSAQARARLLSLVLTERPRAPLFPVEELVALGRQPHTGARGTLSAADQGAIEQAMVRAGVLDLRMRHLGQLSDGQLQRVMIARALAQETPVLALDEPTAFLDLPHRLSTLRLLRQLAQAEGKAVLLSTHELDLALRLADRLWLLGPEGLLQGAPEDLALSGALERAFGAPVLDPLSEESSPAGGQLRIEVEGAAKRWAEQAVLRAHWRIDDQATLVLRQEAGAWVLGERRFELLGPLVDHLRGR
ncbi:MAG: ABC transporter ATP-binding protein [bacterium]|nr:ABC transporter ATP-binding protein [bacterium]